MPISTDRCRSVSHWSLHNLRLGTALVAVHNVFFSNVFLKSLLRNIIHQIDNHRGIHYIKMIDDTYGGYHQISGITQLINLNTLFGFVQNWIISGACILYSTPFTLLLRIVSENHILIMEQDIMFILSTQCHRKINY